MLNKEWIPERDFQFLIDKDRKTMTRLRESLTQSLPNLINEREYHYSIVQENLSDAMKQMIVFINSIIEYSPSQDKDRLKVIRDLVMKKWSIYGTMTFDTVKSAEKVLEQYEKMLRSLKKKGFKVHFDHSMTEKNSDNNGYHLHYLLNVNDGSIDKIINHINDMKFKSKYSVVERYNANDHAIIYVNKTL